MIFGKNDILGFDRFDPIASARWVSPAQVDKIRRKPTQVAGLVCHGDLQPKDRTDAWSRHPRRPELDQALVSAIIRSGPAKPQPGGYKKMIVIVSNLDGRGEEFRIGNNEQIGGSRLVKGKVYHRWQLAPNSGWSGYAPLFEANTDDPGEFNQIAAFRNLDGRMEVLAFNDAVGVTYRKWQWVPSSGDWSPWVASA